MIVCKRNIWFQPKFSFIFGFYYMDMLSFFLVGIYFKDKSIFLFKLWTHTHFLFC